ncbi:MAG: AmmeMemoRadiSam system protein A [Lachnospiraceae bacterium]|nr:AmmeMemoRadiSam system protein A [Lachnospiraceae bacterium]
MSILAGYIVPHPPLAVHEVGRGDEEAIQATLDSYMQVAQDIASLKPDTIIVTSPHTVMYGDYFHISPRQAAHGDFGSFRASSVFFDVAYDTELVSEIEHKCYMQGFPAGCEGERDMRLDHGVMVPLYFINKCYKDYKLVRIGLSGLSLEAHKNFGQIINAAVESLGRRVVFVASGDLSHCQKEDGPYGYKIEGPEYDKKLMAVLDSGDLTKLFDFDEELLEKAEECGHRSFCILAGAFNEQKVDIKPLSHEATFGVGYGFGIIKPMGKIKEEKEADPYVSLARYTVEKYIKSREIPKIPEDTPAELTDGKAGVFVSIHENGLLRGCIGTISASCDSIAEEIIGNAISASTKDPRFRPIEEEELPFLDISVDVLGATEDIDSSDELDPKRYGVIVTKGMRRGLLLPNLDGVDTVEEQISIAKQKAGIRDNEEVSLQRFEVVRHE